MLLIARDNIRAFWKNNSMRIYLILGGEFYYLGGWEKHIKELAYFLASHGYRVKIICRMGKTFSYHIEMANSGDTKLCKIKVVSKLKKSGE